MQSDAEAATLLSQYGLADLPRIRDTGQEVYRPFELPRGNLSQVMGSGVWGAGLKSVLSGILPGVPSADVSHVAFDSDGKRVAIAGRDSAIHTWEVPAAQPSGPAITAAGLVVRIGFNPNGRDVIAVDGEGSL